MVSHSTVTPMMRFRIATSGARGGYAYPSPIRSVHIKRSRYAASRGRVGGKQKGNQIE